jgi:dihydrofolate reductase
MSTVDHIVMGRGTYEKILTFDSWPYAKQVIVLSTTLPPDEDKRVTVTRDIAQTVQLLSPSRWCHRRPRPPPASSRSAAN